MLNTLSDPYQELAWWVGVSALGLTLLLILVIVGLRLSLRRDMRREAAFIAVWRPILLEVISEGTPKMPAALRSGDQLYFLKLWNYLHESLKGPASDRLNALARQLGCDKTARNLLKKGHRAERLLALLTLGHLRDLASWDELAQQATQSDRLASIHAARALIYIDPLKGTELMLPLMLTRQDWDITQIANFLGEANQAFLLHLSKNIIKIDKQHWTRALLLANALHLQLPLPSMQFILTHYGSVDTLVAALHKVSSPQLLPTVRSFLLHPDWRVRVEAVRFMSQFGGVADVPQLQSLLQDEQWWVRYSAAEALADMPFFGTGKLRELRGHATDNQALAMLDHVLAEREASTGSGGFAT